MPMGDASQQRKCAHLVTSSSAQLASTSSLFCQFYIDCHADPLVVSGFKNFHADTNAHSKYIIESVDSISKDERGFPLTQYITNGRISRGGYIFTHFKHHHRVLRLLSYSISV